MTAAAVEKPATFTKDVSNSSNLLNIGNRREDSSRDNRKITEFNSRRETPQQHGYHAATLETPTTVQASAGTQTAREVQKQY
jgi:hypothetical protein